MSNITFFLLNITDAASLITANNHSSSNNTHDPQVTMQGKEASVITEQQYANLISQTENVLQG